MSTPTQDVLDRMEARRESLRADAERILVRARDAGRSELDHSDSERVRELTANLRSLDTEITQYRADVERATLPERYRHLGTSGMDATGQGRVWAKQTAHELRQAFGSERRAVISGSVDVSQLIPQYVTGIPHPQRLIDLLPQRIAVESMAYEYFRQIARVNNAAPVPDNAQKPTSVLTVQAIQDRCRVIAHLSEPLPFRIWLDENAITSWLNAEMVAGVYDAVEFQAIRGDGTGENCEGLLSVDGTTQVPFNSDRITSLRDAQTALQKIGETPSGWALSPDDAAAIDLLRWGSGGGFLSGGYENDPKTGFGTSDNIFGTTTPRVVSPSVPVGTAILGDWSQLALFTREQMRIDLDASGVLFQKNQIQLRAESRVGVGVLRPQAFAICDLTATTRSGTAAKK